MLAALMLAIVACSTQKNTPNTRWWHSFTAKYNTYYNATLAYIDASTEKEQGNKDNFTEMIPLYTVGNKNSREIGKGNYERAIEKCEKAIHQHSIKRKPEWNKKRRKRQKDIDWLSRREYNPFLWKAWLLMGRSQFFMGNFDEAASTFSYMSRMYQTQPAIYGKARAWLAKSYVEQDWLYDAEDVIRNMERDSMDWRAVKEWDYTYADYYIHTGEYAKAIPYLRKVIRHEMRKKQKAREWFLMGQLQAAVGNKEEAYKAYKRVVRLNPPYELEFNAQIAMTEVLSAGRTKQMISRLKRMAANDNNKDYLDQVYYAMGNIYLADKDTTKAIAAYEKGNKKATRSGIEKGVLLLKLGDIYWQKEKFSDARRCYGEAIGLLDKDRKDYKQLSERSVVLDELCPYTDAIHLQDSLQWLAGLPEKERLEAIDRVIEELKKKEKEERKAQQEQDAAQQMSQNASQGAANIQRPTTTPTPQQNTGGGPWYFYNTMAVQQGKASFEKLWGKRENADDWQRSNKTVVGNINGDNGEEIELTDEQRDSIAAAEAVQDSLANVADSAQNDPHKREYYLAQIPFTEEQIAASNDIIKDGLHHSGVIFKDKLDNLPLSEKQFMRLVTQYPDYTQMDEVYYHLFLLYSRLGSHQTADNYVQKLKADYPESQWTGILSDPYFKENAKFGKHIEDSLYAATYDAFKNNRYDEVSGNTYISETRFPNGENRDKFLFIGGLSKLNNGDAAGCLEDMKLVVSKHPKSKLAEMAGMIVNGVNAGRQLYGGKFDLDDVWSRRTQVLNDSDSINSLQFSKERLVNHIFMLAYSPDSVNENQMLFEMAKFNFTNFLVRNFDLTIDDDGGLRRMQVTGFHSYEEALEYARQVRGNNTLLKQIKKAKAIVISEPNLALIGTRFSYKDYDEFYNKNFAPLKIGRNTLLNEPEELHEEPTPRDLPKMPGVLDIKDRQDSISAANDSISTPTDVTTMPSGQDIPNDLIDINNGQPTDVFDINTNQPTDVFDINTNQPTDVFDINTNQPTDVFDINTDQPTDVFDVNTNNPVNQPTEKPAEQPTVQPSVQPTEQPTEQPGEDDDIFNLVDPLTIPNGQDNINDDTFIIPEPPTTPERPTTPEIPETIDIPVTPESPTTPETPVSQPPVTPVPQQTTAPSQQPKQQQQQLQPQQQTQQPIEIQEPQTTPVTPQDNPDDTGIYFDDGFGTNNNNQNNNNQNNQEFNLEDEYYELDGF